MSDPQRGLSLVEAMIVTGIIIATTAATIPGFSAVMDRIRVTTAATEFRIALALSRNEAIRRRQRIDLLPNRLGNWQSGWQVVIDTNNNQVADADEFVLYRGPTVPASVDISARLSDAKRSYVAFDPSGRPRSASSSTVPQFGTVFFQCGMQRRHVVIGMLGRARICDPDRDGAAC